MSALDAYRAAMEAAIGADIESAAAAEEFVRWNESRPALTTSVDDGRLYRCGWR